MALMAWTWSIKVPQRWCWPVRWVEIQKRTEPHGFLAVAYPSLLCFGFISKVSHTVDSMFRSAPYTGVLSKLFPNHDWCTRVHPGKPTSLSSHRYVTKVRVILLCLNSKHNGDHYSALPRHFLYMDSDTGELTFSFHKITPVENCPQAV